ncbi:MULTISPECIES: hypothetical protein [Paenibacillus]|uniref:hypothetical protein n=1 Tax=Paenibacillus TaxID=44249 RepID=UPI00034E9D27|nr:MULTISPECIES: hypothetical protein [Paenibacillus]EPD81526.1 hypothetical protein HMPREF1207_05284 [Paenibacillus sp. HGH0039]MBV6715298.1 hypothetical protein [Paenibacillus chitinolyticus]
MQLKMKKTIVSLILATIVSSFLAISTFANSYTWSFKLDHRVIDGSSSENNKFYSLDAGVLGFSGAVSVYSLDPYSTYELEPVKILVYERKFGLDRFVGSTTVTPGRQSAQTFFTNFGSQPAGSYYIKAIKDKDDGNNIEATGSINTFNN